MYQSNYIFLFTCHWYFFISFLKLLYLNCREAPRILTFISTAFFLFVRLFLISIFNIDSCGGGECYNNDNNDTNKKWCETIWLRKGNWISSNAIRTIMLKRKYIICNRIAIVIPIVTDIFGTVLKGLVRRLEELEIGGRTENIQTTALLRSTRILRWVRKTWGDLLSLRLQWKTIS